jgi:hypothetical protein
LLETEDRETEEVLLSFIVDRLDLLDKLDTELGLCELLLGMWGFQDYYTLAINKGKPRAI